MYNDHYLLKRIEDEQGAVSYASATDSFTSRGEVLEIPLDKMGKVEFMNHPQIGDKVRFYKDSGEDIAINGEQRKAVKFEDIIMKL